MGDCHEISEASVVDTVMDMPQLRIFLLKYCRGISTAMQLFIGQLLSGRALRIDDSPDLKRTSAPPNGEAEASSAEDCQGNSSDACCSSQSHNPTLTSAASCSSASVPASPQSIALPPTSPLSSSPSSSSSFSAPHAALYSGVMRGAAVAGGGERRIFLSAGANARPSSSENAAVPSRTTERGPLRLPSAGRLQAPSGSPQPGATQANHFPLQGLLNSSASTGTGTGTGRHGSGAGLARGELSARS